MDPSHYHLNPIALFSFLTVLYLVLFAFWGLSLNPRAKTNQAFFLMSLHALVWQLGTGFMLCSKDPGWAERWYRFAYLGVVFIGPGVFLFTSSITHRATRNKWLIVAAYALAFLFSMEGVLGRSAITGMQDYPWGFHPRYGPLSLLFLSLFFLLMIAVFHNLYRGLQTVQSGFERKQIKALIVAFSIAYFAALDFVPCFGIEVYPVGFLPIAVFVTLMFWSIYRYQLLDPSPESLARNVIATIADSIIVLDADGFIRMANPKLGDLLGYTSKELLHRHFSSFVDPRSADTLQSLLPDPGHDPEKGAESGVILLRNKEGRSIPTSCNVSAIRDWKGDRLGTVLACRDLQEILRSKEIIQEQEAALRETQERYSALFSRSLFCVFVHDFEGNFLDANEAALRLLGYTREEIFSTNMASLLTEELLPEAAEGLKYIQRHGAQKELTTWKLKRKDGDSVWVETEASLIYRFGKPYAIQGIARDITERRQAEQALRESEERYRTLVDAAPESIVLVDVEGRIRTCNPATESLTGYRAEELEGKSLQELMTLHPDDMPRVQQVFEDLVLGRNVETFELQSIRKDGTKQWTSVKLGLLRSGEEVTGILVISRDLTERKQMEDALRESEERYRMLFESSPEAITLIGMDGRILDCNPATTKITGLPREQMLGQAFMELATLHEEKMSEYMDLFSRLVRGEPVQPLEHETLRSDGSTQWTDNYMALLKRQHEPFAIQVISRDITERKLAEEERKRHQEHLKDLVEDRTAELRKANEKLRQEIAERILVEEKLRTFNEELDRRVRERTAEIEKANEELQELDKIKDSFLSSVSHELRTPLTSIRSFSEILLNYDDEEAATRREFLGIINAESERLTRLINDLLDLSRMDAGGMIWNDVVVCLEEVVRDVLRTYQGLLEEKSLEVTLDWPPDVPSVLADRDRIHQVVANLVGNAIKFSDRGGEIRIQVLTFQGNRSGEVSPWIRVSVSDQGIGIDEKDFAVVFDRFRQVSPDTLKDKPQGTGLGLPISKEIVTHYGGNLWVRSQKGKGSTFFFTLPAARADAEVVSGRRGASERPNGKTIVLVEENPNARRVLCSQLERKGFVVLESTDIDELLALPRKHRIDLILIDLMMPALAEQDILRTLRESPETENIPVLIISVVESHDSGILPGAQGVLRKPFREEDLIRKVQGLLDGQHRSILVVDDDSGVRNTLRMHLEDLGYPVYLAGDGDEAVDLLKVTVPDLVILDLVMPGRTGQEVLSWIRNNQDTRDLPVIILSALPLSGEIDRLRSLGIEAFVEKTKDLSTLFHEVNSILEIPLH